MGDYIFVNSNVSTKTYEVCDRMAIAHIKSTATAIFVLVVGFSIGGLHPLMTCLSDERILFVPVIFPYTNPESLNGFYINFTHQIIVGVIGSLGVFVCEMITCVIRNVFVTVAAVVEHSISEFTELIKMDKRISKTKKFHFRNIILKILDFHG